MDISDFCKIGYEDERVYTKAIGNIQFNIFVGIKDDVPFSYPEVYDLDINSYNYVTIEICDLKEIDILSADFEKTLGIQDLNLKSSCYNGMSYYKVTIEQLEAVYEALKKNQGINNQVNNQVDKKCCICGCVDEYANEKNGKVYCYRHVPGY